MAPARKTQYLEFPKPCDDVPKWGHYIEYACMGMLTYKGKAKELLSK
jgi:hypothetical protein